MITQPLRLLLFSTLLSLLFCSCGKEEKEFEKLELYVDLVDGEYKCSWSGSNISSFEHYRLFYSVAPINELAQFQDADKEIIILDQKTNAWDFVIDHFVPTLYFQLEINIGERMIKSNVVKVFNDKIHAISINPDKVIPYIEKDAVYISERNTDRLIFYDLVTKTIKKERILDSEITAFTVGDNGFGEELYLIEEGNTLIILDANTLEEKERQIFNHSIYSVVTNEKGMIFLTVGELDSSLQIFYRAGLIMHSTHNYSNYIQERGLAFLSKENNQLIEVDQNRPFLYTFENFGDLVNATYSVVSTGNTNKNTILTVSPNGNYFVKSSDGMVYQSNLEVKYHLSTVTNREYLSFAFDEDEEYIYAAINTSSTFSYKFHRFSLSNLELEEKLLNNYQPKKIFNYQGVIMAAAKSNSENSLNIFPLIF